MTFAVAANEKGEKVLTMSKEYIERQRAIVDACNSLELYPSEYAELENALNRIPAADVVEVRHGRWTIAEDEYYGLNIVKCSVCHEEWCFEEGDDVFDLNYHYCPNCGCKMDKEVADDKKQPEEAPGE